MMTIDLGVRFTAVAAAELARVLSPARPQLVVSVATLGIPVAFEVSRCLGLDDYLILQKSPKVHLRDCLRESAGSITSTATQQLLLDRRRIGCVDGRRVAFVDDVIRAPFSQESTRRRKLRSPIVRNTAAKAITTG